MPSGRRSLPVIQFGTFPKRGLVHGITGRTDLLPLDGDVSYVTGADSELVRANRATWGTAIGVSSNHWVCAQQVHKARAMIVGAAESGRGSLGFTDALPGTDILVTEEPGLPLVIFCADCTPILLVDPIRRSIAVAHAGWRGTVLDAAGEAVRMLQREFGTRPEDIIAGIGPAIGPCCYDVGSEVIEAWMRTGIDPGGAAVVDRPARQRFDLWEANRRCLVAAGVPSANIEVAGICTRCNARRFFSHRSGVAPEGRFAAVIALDGGSTHGRA